MLKTASETPTAGFTAVGFWDALASILNLRNASITTDIDWAERWRSLVVERAAAAGAHGDPSYWDRRAPSFARSTRGRVDEFLNVLEPYLSPRKTLIDVGAGAGRHALPLAERLEWVTAVEPSEGMRALIPPRDNMTVVASSWEDAAVAPADLLICCHVLYGVDQPVPFIAKMERSARERVFVMLREGPLAHPAAAIRRQMPGAEEPRMPRFSDLFMLLTQMRIAPDVSFFRYPSVQRYASFDEAMADCRALIGEGWDESRARAVLNEVLREDAGELVFDGGVTQVGVAHWQPSTD
jgi:SAM-dependent methyltransferase